MHCLLPICSFARHPTDCSPGDSHLYTHKYSCSCAAVDVPLLLLLFLASSFLLPLCHAASGSSLNPGLAVSKSRATYLVEGGGFEPPKLTRQIYSLIPLAAREPLQKAAVDSAFGPTPCQTIQVTNEKLKHCGLRSLLPVTSTCHKQSRAGFRNHCERPDPDPVPASGRQSGRTGYHPGIGPKSARQTLEDSRLVPPPRVELGTY